MRHRSRLGKTVGELFYFLGSGMTWGVLLGTLSGTLIAPVGGTIFSAIWGWGIGMVLGLVAAFMAACLYPIRPTPQDVRFYRRGLTLLIGGMTAVGAPILLLLSTRGILWGDFSPFANWAFAPSMLAAFVLGGLAAANTASLYTHDYLAEPDPLAKFGNVASTFGYFAARPAHLLWIGLFAAMYSASHLLPDAPYGYPSPIDGSFSGFMTHFMSCVVGGGVITLLVCLVLGTLIGFLNRLFFVEYASHWTLERYRAVLMVLVGGITLVLVLAWAFTWLNEVKNLLLISAPLILFYSMWLARGYAERYYDMEGKPKRKGKPKNEVLTETLA